jgi:hypothetical protein
MVRTLLHVAFTMDCERIAAESPSGGPETWELSERAISGFCSMLLEGGIPPTLFLTPECGTRHRQLLRGLSRKGIELGLHVHPQSLGDHRYDRYLGEYGYAAQRQIIEEGIRAFQHTFGRSPRSFRPGNFSANGKTFRVLSDLGFGQGSVSDPGRNSPQFAAVWTGSYPLPHWASARNRLRPGGLRFLEVPLTTDPDRSGPNGFPYELRIESGRFREHHEAIIRQALGRVAGDPPSTALCLFTHNYFEYEDPGCEQVSTLEDIVEHLGALAGYDVMPTTLSGMTESYLGLLGPPRDA